MRSSSGASYQMLADQGRIVQPLGLDPEIFGGFFPFPFVFRISAFTSFRISFSERMYASGLYLMDFLKLMRLRHLIRYFLRSQEGADLRQEGALRVLSIRNKKKVSCF